MYAIHYMYPDLTTSPNPTKDPLTGAHALYEPSIGVRSFTDYSKLRMLDHVFFI